MLRHINRIIEPLKSLLLIFSTISFLLNGGLGTVASVSICTDGDGQVHLELAFQRCCADPHGDQDRNGSGAEVGAASNTRYALSTSDDCGLCTDQRILSGKNHALSHQILKKTACQEIKLDLLAACPVSTVEGVNDSTVLGHYFDGHADTHSSPRTVVLRC